MNEEASSIGKTDVKCAVVLLLGIASFSCCIAAEFKKVKEKYMKLDGSLCSLPRSCAFELGIAALVCLSIAQVVGTTRPGGSRICSTHKAANISRVCSIILLLTSWVMYGLATILLATASSMNGGQAYGKGWMNGDCYVVHDGVFAGAAVLVVSMVALVLVFNFTKKERRVPTRLHGWNLEGAGNESTLAEKVTLAHLVI